VRVLSLAEIDLGLAAIVGLLAGYVMAMLGLWAGRVPGLVTVDVADFGRRYMVSDRPSAWVFGLLSHLANSILFVIAFATLILPNVRGSRVLWGLVWGEVLGVALAGGLIAPMSSLGFLGMRTQSVRLVVTSALLHAAWGVMVGWLYVPR
jgi:hypothetical protein